MVFMGFLMPRLQAHRGRSHFCFFCVFLGGGGRLVFGLLFVFFCWLVGVLCVVCFVCLNSAFQNKAF